MFYEGDEVLVTNLNEDVQEMLADALECDFEEIEFYFVEYHDEDYAVLSAETDYKFAIVHCPLNALEGYYDDAATAQELIDHVINTLILDRALDERNKELFDAIMEYNAAKEFRVKEEEPQHLYMHLLEELSEEEYDALFRDED